MKVLLFFFVCLCFLSFSQTLSAEKERPVQKKVPEKKVEAPEKVDQFSEIPALRAYQLPESKDRKLATRLIIAIAVVATVGIVSTFLLHAYFYERPSSMEPIRVTKVIRKKGFTPEPLKKGSKKDDEDAPKPPRHVITNDEIEELEGDSALDSLY